MAKQTFMPAKVEEKKADLSPGGYEKIGHRPRKYTEEVHATIVQAIRDGNSVNTAGLLAGLGKDTLFMWLDHARKKPEQYPEYVQLDADIAQARAERQEEMVAVIAQTATSGMPNTWQAAAWYLERTDPENWGRKDKMEVSGNKENPVIQLNQVILVDSDAREEGRAFLRRVTGNSSSEPIGTRMGDELEKGPRSLGQGSDEPIEVEARPAR